MLSAVGIVCTAQVVLITLHYNCYLVQNADIENYKKHENIRRPWVDSNHRP